MKGYPMTPEKLKDARGTLKMTQNQLSDYLGISERQYRRYETGYAEIIGPVQIVIDILLTRRIPKLKSKFKAS